jgi:hypothetical protein
VLGENRTEQRSLSPLERRITPLSTDESTEFPSKTKTNGPGGDNLLER